MTTIIRLINDIVQIAVYEVEQIMVGKHKYTSHYSAQHYFTSPLYPKGCKMSIQIDFETITQENRVIK